MQAIIQLSGQDAQLVVHDNLEELGGTTTKSHADVHRKRLAERLCSRRKLLAQATTPFVVLDIGHDCGEWPEDVHHPPLLRIWERVLAKRMERRHGLHPHGERDPGKIAHVMKDIDDAT